MNHHISKFGRPFILPLNQSRRSRGITLIELMVVVAILAILLTLGIVAYQEVLEQNKVSQTKMVLSMTMEAVEAFKDDKGYYLLDPSHVQAGEITNATRLFYKNNTYNRNIGYWRPFVLWWKEPGFNRDGAPAPLFFIRRSQAAREAELQIPPDLIQSAWLTGRFQKKTGIDEYKSAQAIQCTAVLDGFGNPLFYSWNGGRGNKPVVVSCGSDGMLGYADADGDGLLAYPTKVGGIMVNDPDESHQGRYHRDHLQTDNTQPNPTLDNIRSDQLH